MGCFSVNVAFVWTTYLPSGLAQIRCPDSVLTSTQSDSLTIQLPSPPSKSSEK